jgi:hypothetical protein
MLVMAAVAVARLVAPMPRELPDAAAWAILAYRLLSALSGTLEVAVVFSLARVFVRPPLALAAAALAAVLPLPVICSKYGTPDAMLALFFSFCLWLALRLVGRPSGRLYFLSGLCAALAIATKYSAVFLLPSFLVAHLAGGGAAVPDRAPDASWTGRLSAVLRAGRPGRWPAAFGGGLALGALAGFAPLFLPHQMSILLMHGRSEYLHLYQDEPLRFKIGGPEELYTFHLRHTLLPAMGAPLLAAALAGGAIAIVSIFRRREAAWRKHLVVLACVGPYYVAIEHAFKVFPVPDRYALPLVGVSLAYAALAVESVLGRIERPSRRSGALVIVALSLATYPAWKTARVLGAMGEDTRKTMKSWMTAHLPPGTRVSMQNWLGPLGRTFYPDLRGAGFVEVELGVPPRRDDPRRPREAPNYALASSLVYTRFLDYPDADPVLTTYYEDLFSRGIADLVFEAESPGGRYLFQSPTLRLYRYREQDAGR